ncbi:MAG: DUF2156 domain-containing protein [Thermoguttaceae bacterium]|nr:DUF2156 domain-containing protein [Thermoguttaceae bacterium]
MNRKASENARLPLAPPTLADAPLVRAAVERSGLAGNELNFANVFLLQEKHRTTIAFRNRFFFRYYDGQRLAGYGFPIGDGDVETALRAIFDDSESRGRAPKIALATRTQAATLRRLFPGKFRFSCDRGDADYLYSTERLASLSGRRMHRKRNAVKRFERERSGLRVEPLTVENLEAAAFVAERWRSNRPDAEAPELAAETRALETAFRFFEELKLFGRLVLDGDEPLGFALLSSTSALVCNEHFEKATPDGAASYPLLCRDAARLALERGARWLNREEDLNSQGLRTAKSAWFPELLPAKFNAVERAFGDVEPDDLDVWDAAAESGDEATRWEAFESDGAAETKVGDKLNEITV